MATRVRTPLAERSSYAGHIQWIGGIAFSAALIAAAWAKTLPLEMTEVLGFLTGALSVWLVAKNNVWTWPIGIINSAFYIYVFGVARLYADAGLQVFFIVTGVLGWYWWLRGGENRQELPISHASVRTLLIVGGCALGATALLTLLLRQVNDAAPFLDALTAILSLAATYVMARRHIENWYLWITVDLFSIGLYLTKGLPLTAVLYAIYLAMCLYGLANWWRAYRHETRSTENREGMRVTPEEVAA